MTEWQPIETAPKYGTPLLLYGKIKLDMDCHKHLKTGEIFEEIRSLKNQYDPYISEDGCECEYVPSFTVDSNSAPVMLNKNAEVWERDSSYVKKMKPKYVRRQDGIKERYDPNKHF